MWLQGQLDVLRCPPHSLTGRETMTLVFTDVPDVFVDDVIALIRQ